MPNWSNTNYAIKGKKEEIYELGKIMKEVSSMETPLVPNGFGPNWLGCLFERLGVEANDKVHCRGDYYDVEIIDGVLRFTTSTAWNKSDDFEDLLVENFPSIDIFYYEEECGTGIYETNDTNKEFFPYDYVLFIEDQGESHYCENMDEVCSLMSDYLKKKMDEESVEEYLELNEDDEDFVGYVYLEKVVRLNHFGTIIAVS